MKSNLPQYSDCYPILLITFNIYILIVTSADGGDVGFAVGTDRTPMRYLAGESARTA